MQRSITIADLAAMDTNHDGSVDRGEFLAFFLVALQKVEQKDIDELLELFDRLDVSRTGSVSRSDVRAGTFIQKLKTKVNQRQVLQQKMLPQAMPVESSITNSIV